MLAIKRWFPFNLLKVLQGCHLVMSGSKNFKLLLEISFDIGFESIAMLSLLLFLCSYYC